MVTSVSKSVLLVLLLGSSQIAAWLQSHPCGHSIHQCQTPTRLASAASDDDQDTDDTIARPEKSQMNKFINQYLNKNRQAESEDGGDVDIGSDVLETSTHMVAIPMDACHELLLELESVQRAILYHCPILADACIPGSMTRLPLLYVQANREASADVTVELTDTVQQLIQKHMFVSPIAAEDDYFEEDLNTDGIQPVAITFQSLEIDGDNNNVLSTVGMADDEGTKKLQAFVCELKEQIEARGWKTAFPSDPHQEDTYRPRVPFMELPQKFDRNLNKLRQRTEVSEEDMEFLTSDEGGNGISPIFWCQWWDDVFGRNIRLRHVGIYPRSQPGSVGENNDLSYTSFYLPYETIALPDGNAVMAKKEQKFQKYQDDRLVEEQEKMTRGKDDAEKERPYEEPDFLMNKTRERLEKLYINSGAEDSTILDDGNPPNETGTPSSDKTKASDRTDEDEEEDLDLKPVTASPDDYMNDWMKERIKSVVGSMESIKSRTPEKKEKPPIEDNPVFKAYKDGTLEPEAPKAVGKKKELGPYPSDEHFFGIWKVVTSPTGFPQQESSEEQSENLILRVDGTTAGGPVLDPETNQKAAGGTWKMTEENGDANLRIRLVIPPKKDRIIEMSGRVTRFSTDPGVQMASKAFGVSHLEEMARQANKGDREDVMQCSGEVFVEDAITKKNREQIGTFSLVKVQDLLGPSQYTITIPRPVRSQD